MLSSLSNLLSKNDHPKPSAQDVIMLGLCHAGKTTILYRLILNKFITVIPTQSVNKETVTLPSSLSSQGMKKYAFSDHSGHLGDIRLWHHHLKGGIPVIFVVDSAERDVYEARRALEWMYSACDDDAVKSGILLVLCNKQDRPDAASVEEIKDQLKLEDMWKWGIRWHIRGVSAKTGEGIGEAMEWLETQLSGPALPTSFVSCVLSKYEK